MSLPDPGESWMEGHRRGYVCDNSVCLRRDVANQHLKCSLQVESAFSMWIAGGDASEH